jgi:hypothetical protein
MAIACSLSSHYYLYLYPLFLSCSPLHAMCDRYLDPDPLLLAAPHGNGDEVNTVNPRFHALNQALVQLVSCVGTSLTRNQPFYMGTLSRAGARICEKKKTRGRARPRYFVAPSLSKFSSPRRESAHKGNHDLPTPSPVNFFFELPPMSILVF